MTRAEIDEILASPIPWADEADQKRCEVCIFLVLVSFLFWSRRVIDTLAVVPSVPHAPLSRSVLLLPGGGGISGIGQAFERG